MNIDWNRCECGKLCQNRRGTKCAGCFAKEYHLKNRDKRLAGFNQNYRANAEERKASRQTRYWLNLESERRDARLRMWAKRKADKEARNILTKPSE